MKDRKEKSRIPILAAGGIVVRNGLYPQFAVVQSRKLETWGLPKGKLASGEDVMTAARREVLEETGYSVTVHEFLGTLAYETSSRHKVVQFWRMEASGNPVGDLMRDVRAVRWLALADAIRQLTHLRERVFLQQVGPIALQFAEAARRDLSQQSADRNIVPGVPLAPAGGVFFPGQAGEDDRAGLPEQQPQDFVASLLPAADVLTAAGLSGQVRGTELVEKTLVRKSLVKKTWGWFRHAAMMQRQID